MAVLWFTGFEGGHALKEPFSTVSGSGVTVGAGYARTGAYGCRLNPTSGVVGSGHMKACSNNNGAVDQSFAADTRLHFYLKIVTLPPATERAIVAFFYRRGVANGLTLVLEDDGSLSLYEVNYSTNATVDLGNSTLTYNDGNWHAIQIKDDYHGGSPSHSYELLVDDKSKISGTTSNFGTNNVAAIYFGQFDLAFDSSYDIYIDDVAVTSDAYISYPFSISMFLPDENGTYTAWTGDYTDVDDIPPNGTDEIRGTTVASARESFFCEDSVGTGLGKTIAAVKANYVCKRGGAGDQTHFSIRDPGDTNRDTAVAVSLPAAYIAFATIWNTNPDTSAAWTSAEVDATELGILNVDPESFSSYCDAMQLHVLYAGLAGRPMIAYNFGG